MSSWIRPRRSRLLKGLSLVTVGAFCVLAPRLAEWVSFQTALDEKTTETLDDALSKNLKTFLIVSAVKSGMAVIEGARVGVGFDVEVGDVIQPAYDYINFIWEVFLYALLVLGFYKILMETGFLGLGVSIFGVGCLLAGYSYLSSRSRPRVRVLARRLVLIGLLFSYVVPLALMSTHYLGAWYTTPLKEKYAQKIQDYSGQFESARTEFLSLKDNISLMNPSGSLDEIRTKLMQIVRTVNDSIRGSLSAFLYYVVLVLFELLVFPFLTAFVLHRGVQLALEGIIVRQAVLKPTGEAVISA
ncbi:MAG: hypothetical protein HZB26_10110 [Candidatus Hydrogenedentes bacterium]|nr:hypothetical protein [Candidatus Hydrogenedentota bacterium]